MEEIKHCPRCDEFLPLTQFYYRTDTGYRNHCKECEKTKNREKYLKRREAAGGANRVYNEPNKYFDEGQRKASFEFLELLGWSFNPINNIWYKEGIKNPDGNFINVKEDDLAIRLRQRRLTKEDKRAIVEDYFKSKQYRKEIAKKYNLNPVTVSQYIKEYLNENK